MTSSPPPPADRQGTRWAPDPTQKRFVAKALQVTAIILGTMVAGMPVSNLIAERQERQAEVRAEFERTWGPAQSIQVPLLVVPFVKRPNDVKREYVMLAPESAIIHATVSPQERRRGLFSATVYTATVHVTGSFALPSQARVEALAPVGATILWDAAILVMKTRGLGSLSADNRVTWNGETMPWQSCNALQLAPEECQPTLLVARPDLGGPPAAGRTVPFQASVTVRGTGSLKVVPEGMDVTAVMEAPWPAPSFAGDPLPVDTTVDPDSFKAQWRILNPSQYLMWASPALKLPVAIEERSAFGVDLLEATPVYLMVTRASKYAVLFVVLSFSVYAVFELLGTVRITVVQYALTGLSMTLFALLLVAFAEPLGYAAGYGISAGLVTAQASAYTASVTRRRTPTLVFAACLSGLFGFLYVLLGLETYALLSGAMALFVTLCAVMAVTQRLRRHGLAA